MSLEFSDLKQLHLAFNSKFYMRVISQDINHSDDFYSLMTIVIN